MVNPQQTENKKNTKLPLPLILFGLAVIVIGGSYFAFNSMNSTADNSKDKGSISSSSSSVDASLQGSLSVPQFWNQYAELESTKVYGQISGLDTSYATYFLLGSEDNPAFVWYDNMSDTLGNSQSAVSVADLANGDYVLVEGNVSPDQSGIWANKISKVSETDITAYEDTQKPMLDIEIIDYPRSVAHGCGNIKMQVKLKNTGQVPIEHSKIYDSSNLYYLFYEVNGVLRWDFSTLGDDPDTIADTGMKDFGTLQPGEETTAEFGGGGVVTKSIDPSYGDDHVVGIGGSPNIISPGYNGGGQTGSNSFQLKLGLIESDFGDASWSDPLFTSESNIVKMDLASDECDLNEITDTYYVGQ